MSYFPDVPTIPFEGPDSRNPLAFRYYNPDEMIEGQSMRDLLRFSVCYWHTFRGTAAIRSGPARLCVPGKMEPTRSIWR